MVHASRLDDWLHAVAAITSAVQCRCRHARLHCRLEDATATATDSPVQPVRPSLCVCLLIREWLVPLFPARSTRPPPHIHRSISRTLTRPTQPHCCSLRCTALHRRSDGSDRHTPKREKTNKKTQQSQIRLARGAAISSQTQQQILRMMIKNTMGRSEMILDVYDVHRYANARARVSARPKKVETLARPPALSFCLCTDAGQSSPRG